MTKKLEGKTAVGLVPINALVSVYGVVPGLSATRKLTHYRSFP